VDWYDRHKRDSALAPYPRPVQNLAFGNYSAANTRGAQGLPYYQAFIAERYPTVAKLAACPARTKCCALWQGLGYYSRARNLHACAKKVVNEHHGKIPQQRTKSF
jgi:A/G-specific adenine glycosylase